MKHAQDRVFLGIDWGSCEHSACIVDESGVVLGQRAFSHDGEGLATLVEWALSFAAGQPSRVWASIEVPHGPVVDTLMDRGVTVHSINPKQVDLFRGRYKVAGAKDDRLDARVLAHTLRTDTECYRRLAPTDPLRIELREWSRIHDELQQSRVRETNRMRPQLLRYYPQFFQVDDDLAADWVLDLWELVPTPAIAKSVRATKVQKALTHRRIRKVDADDVLAILRQREIHVAPGVTEAAPAHIRLLIEHLRVINRQMKTCTQRLESICTELVESSPASSDDQRSEQHHAAIVLSMPGVGRIVGAALLAEADLLLQAADYQGLRTLCGVAPVTKQSGSKTVVKMRYACHERLKKAVHHWGRVAIQHDPKARKQYAGMRARGMGHARAIRGVADRLLAMLCSALRSRRLYDPALRSPQAA